VAQCTRLVDLIQRQIDEFLVSHNPILRAMSPDTAPFIDFSRSFLSTGKRFRARFCYWGWRSTDQSGWEPDPTAHHEESPDFEAIVRVASALELFHAAALVHDDIIDDSNTRRGALSMHRRFATVHHQSGWVSDSVAFGKSAATLLGDLLLAWSDELFESGLDALESRDRAKAVRAEFSQMRSEITIGQYLDVMEENAWPTRPQGELVARAFNVATYKSAKYSVESPLRIGATCGGASNEQKAALSRYGLPLGIAFQLRDDLLGVFGDPKITGKPSGDDLRQGKRTVLVAFARQRLDPARRREFDALLGNPTLETRHIESLQSMVRDSGAVGRVEASIAHHASVANAMLLEAPLTPVARAQLRDLAESAITRVS